jgi:arylformamidase
MSEYIDVTLPLKPEMPFWPDSTGLKLSAVKRMKSGQVCNLSELTIDLHAGTHVDAPWHYVDEGFTTEHLSIDMMLGACYLAHLPDTKEVTAADLQGAGIPAGTTRLLLRTSNSLLWKSNEPEFRKDFVGLSADGAQWLVEHKIGLVGIDYLSVGPFGRGIETHKMLLGAGMVVVEGLYLADVEAGWYELICLPIKLVGAEGAPARVLLKRVKSDQ